MIGCCFGHQIVGRALGAECGRNPVGWETAVNEVQLTQKGKEIFQVDHLVCVGGHWSCHVYADRYSQEINQMHRDMIFYYPQGVEELGSSPACKVQGMYSPKRLLTVQGHPEFNQEIVEEILETRHALGVFNDEQLEASMKRAVMPHDGLVVSQAFVRFLLE